MPVGNSDLPAFAVRRGTLAAVHPNVGGGVVEDHEPVWIKPPRAALLLEPLTNIFDPNVS